MNIKTYTASKARENFFELVRVAAGGLQSFEITLRDSESVVMLSKSELESWMETLDVMSNPEEVGSLKKGRGKREELVSHKQVLEELGIK